MIMARIRDELGRKYIDKNEPLDDRYDYVDIDDVNDALNDIESVINDIIVDMENWEFTSALEKLKELSTNIY
jgi:hypothetical protein